MARLIGTINRYVGTAREIKPYIGQVQIGNGYSLTAADLPIGSEFLEEETGQRFLWNGTTWEPDAGTSQTIRLLTAMSEQFTPLVNEAKKQTDILVAIAKDFDDEEGV